MTKKLVHILELNNIDIYGKRFNGFSLQSYINQHPKLNFSAKLIVNHKLGNDRNVVKLFSSENLELYDWKIEEIEKGFGIKNQISISEEALINHPLYKKADILHFHMYHNMHLPIEFLMRIPPEKQIIIDIHDTFWLTDKEIPMLEVFSYADQKNKQTLDAQRKRVINSIDAHFVLHSPFMLNLAKKSSATKNLDLTLINFGIDNQIFKPLNKESLRKKYNIDKNDLVLLCRSQKEFKGISYINDALKKIKIKQNLTVITVGERGLLDKKDNYNLVELDQISNEKQMAEVFNLCDIFLAPSTEESFGFMAVEAMSCEKPVIAFRGTALPDTINAPHIGIAVKRDSKALANAVMHLANNPDEMTERGKAGRRYVLETYSEQKYFNSYVKLFKKISQAKPRAITFTKNSPTPNNIKDFITMLKKGVASSQSFDYNDNIIQKQLLDYNKTIYNELKKQRISNPVRSAIKKLIPQRFKQYLKNLLKGTHE